MEYQITKLAVLTDSHSAALRYLLSRAEMQTDQLAMTTERWPDVMFLPNLKSAGTLPVGFFRNEILCGFALFCREKRWLSGKPQEVWSLSRIYIAPEGRGFGFLARLTEMPEVVELARGKFGYANVLVGNRAVESYLGRSSKRFPALPNLIEMRENVSSIRGTFGLPKYSKRIVVRRADSGDADELLEVLQQQHQKRLLGRYWNESTLSSLTLGRPDTDWSNWWLAEHNREVIGAVFAWECSRCNQNRLNAMPRHLRMMVGSWNLILSRLGWPRLPNSGEVIPMVSLNDLVIKREQVQVIRAFTREIGMWARRRGVPLLLLTTDAEDPARTSFRSLLGTELRSRLLILGSEKESEKTFQSPQVLHYCDSDLL
ncbi:MAG: hypothetical protein P8L78_14690 [Mariniblastus sp.]|nr:hypothetical protein [Mariniblastus sp.]